MPINLQNIISSRFGIAFALFMGRLVPAWAGRPLANSLADLISARKSSQIVKAARANQWVVSREQLFGPELDVAVQETFRNQARSLYDFYHHMNEAPEKQKILVLDQAITDLYESCLEGKEGKLIVGVHMSNFDFAIQTVFKAGKKRGGSALALTLPELPGGYQWQTQIRRMTGVDIVPTTVSSMRAAVTRLQQGGNVIMGIDRPVPDGRHHPRFFGRPSALPVAHISLALRAKVPIIVGTTLHHPDGTYHLQISKPVNMVTHPDHQVEIIRNAEAILEVAESFISQAPTQWAIFYPVWPEANGEVP